MTLAAYIYAVGTAGVVLFQLAVAAGAKVGHLTMAGRYPGRLPTGMRIAAVLQAGFLVFVAIGVLSKAGLTDALSEWANWMTWVSVGLGVISLGLNLATPSAAERRLWVPIASVLLVASLVIALG